MKYGMVQRAEATNDANTISLNIAAAVLFSHAAYYLPREYLGAGHRYKIFLDYAHSFCVRTFNLEVQ